jgi:curli biogenesis system outer membrane secretion channel CsgG
MKKLLLGLAAAATLSGAGTVFAGGAKPSVAVIEFNNETSAGWWSGGVGWELAGMVSNELAATGSFKVLERSKIEAVLSEQNLAASGRVSAGTGAKIGKLTGAQYLIAGTVSAYEENTASTGGGISFKGISLGGNKESAYLAIDLRVINATTGEIDFVRTIEGNAKGGFGGALGSQKKTPAGKAIRAALIEITDYLDCVMVRQDGCEAEYDAKESRRREKTKGALDLDD